MTHYRRDKKGTEVKKKARNTGVPYEIITKEIFQALVNQDSAKSVTLKHNIVLQGKTTEHQIDVYWEFEFGGINYTAVIQAKDWNKAINKGEVLKFKEVLDDLPGQPRGIIVTSSRYQSGAHELARVNGILLYQLFPEPQTAITMTVGSFATLRICKKTSAGIVDMSDPDAKNAPGALVLETIVFEPVFSGATLHYDKRWFEEHRKRVGARAIDELLSKSILEAPNRIDFYDESGNVIGNLQKIYTSFVEQMRKKEVMNDRKSHAFEAPTFLKSASEILPFIKIVGISSNVVLEKREPSTSYFKIGQMVNYILRNLEKGEEQVFRFRKNSKKRK